MVRYMMTSDMWLPLWTYICVPFHVCITLGSSIFVLASFLLIVVPLWFLLPRYLYYKIETSLFDWVQSMTGPWLWLKGYKVTESGINPGDYAEDEALVLPNHQSEADIALLMWALSSRNYIIGRVLWVMANFIRKTQFGIVSTWRGDVFLTSSKKRDDHEERLVKHIRDIYWPGLRKWIILFPEGGFLKNMIARSQRFAKEYGFPVLDKVSLPRVGAVKAILDTASPKGLQRSGIQPSTEIRPLKWIIDVTIAYSDGRPIELTNLLTGIRPSNTTHIHFRKFPVSEVPMENEEELRDWLYQRWQEKEHILKHIYECQARCSDGNPICGNSKTSQSPNSVINGNVGNLTTNKYKIELDNIRPLPENRVFAFVVYVTFTFIIYVQYYGLTSFASAIVEQFSS